MATWADQYVGIPYEPHTADCAVLVQRVLRERLGVEVPVPRERSASAFGCSAEVLEVVTGALVVAEPPERDCDVVLMRVRGRLWHVGVLVLGSEHWVLHATRITGASRCDRVRDLHRLGMTIEGYYRAV